MPIKIKAKKGNYHKINIKKAKSILSQTKERSIIEGKKVKNK